jgi:hypothetical protein
VRIAGFGAEERDFQGRFKTATNGDDFLKNGLKGCCRKRAAVQFGNSVENFLLAARGRKFLGWLAFCDGRFSAPEKPCRSAALRFFHQLDRSFF